jgi:hypothetical protein
MRRKTSPRPEPRSSSIRPISPATSTSAYGSVLAQARKLGIVAVVTIAPLGALAGTVSACGGAAPVRAYPYEQPQGAVPAVEPIAPPPAASASTSPVPRGQETE